MIDSTVPLNTYLEIAFLMLTLFSTLSFYVYIALATRKSMIMKIYSVAQILMIAVVMIFLAISLLQLEHKKILDYMIASLITFMSYFYVVFAYQYFSEKDMTIKSIILYSMIPIVSLVILGANYFIINLFQSSDFIDYFNRLVSLVLLIVFIRCVVYLHQFRMRVKQHFKMRQSLFFMIAFTSPIMLLVMTVLYIANIDTFYVSIFLPVISTYIYIWGARRQMLDEIPGLLDHVIDHMRDAIVILNGEYEIIDYNKAVISKVIDVGQYRNLDDFIQGIFPIVSKKEILKDIEKAIKADSHQVFVGDIELLMGNRLRQYNYHITKVSDYKQSTIATMMVLHDITELQSVYQAIEDKNKQLKMANQQLEEHVKNINELSLEEERKQLMDEINDTLGHSMTEVLALLEVSSLMIDKKKPEQDILNVLDDSSERSRLALQEIREAVTRYKQ